MSTAPPWLRRVLLLHCTASYPAWLILTAALILTGSPTLRNETLTLFLLLGFLAPMTIIIGPLYAVAYGSGRLALVFPAVAYIASLAVVLITWICVKDQPAILKRSTDAFQTGLLAAWITGTILGFLLYFAQMLTPHLADAGRWPFLAIFSLALTVGCLIAHLQWLRLRRHDWLLQGCCPACGYDLRQTPDRCPECGTPRATEPA